MKQEVRRFKGNHNSLYDMLNHYIDQGFRIVCMTQVESYVDGTKAYVIVLEV